MPKKVCSSCGVEKELEADFQKRKDKKSGWSSNCKSCARKSYLRYQASDKGKTKARDALLKRKYGISLEHYHNTLASQDGLCAICKDPVSGKNAHSDHCHVTGKFRAILCYRCNTGLGFVRDRPDICLAMATYLCNHQGDVSTKPS